MEISGNRPPIDPTLRKRQADAAANRTTPAAGTPRREDAVELGDTSPEAIARYVDILKNMNPADLHKVEELRQRIASGEFTADAQELAEQLDKLLERDGQ